MDMSRTYTDYINKAAITIPDKFIDVKTGDSHNVSSKIQEQIEYHTNNDTLMHLIFSALNYYFHPKAISNKGSDQLLLEILEIKNMLQQGNPLGFNSYSASLPRKVHVKSSEVNLEEVKDILEAFGGKS